MPAPLPLAAPGVYAQTFVTGPPPMLPVSTAATAFVDYFSQGPVADRGTSYYHPVAHAVGSWSAFESRYGGLDPESEASYGILQFFKNGGRIAWVVRVATSDAQAASRCLPTSAPGLTLLATAANPGIWGNSVRVTIQQPRLLLGATPRFDLTVEQLAQGAAVAAESYYNLTLDATDSNFAPTAVNTSSRLLRLALAAGGVDLGAIPGAAAALAALAVDARPLAMERSVMLSGGSDGGVPDLTDSAVLTAALAALDHVEPAKLNLLCLPALAKTGWGAPTGVLLTLLSYCAKQNLFFLVDIPPEVATPEQMEAWAKPLLLGTSAYGAVYFPRLFMPDPLAAGTARNVGASGTLAGLFARNDAAAGVWAAPAGVGARLVGAILAAEVDEETDAELNPLGINCLRSLPAYGTVSWGARTLAGADQLASDWQFVPARRLVTFIEKSLQQILRFAVFQPNGPALWTQITHKTGDFLSHLYARGAFAGATAAQSYFVQCDASTTTAADVAQGIVNVLVGVAPVEPAEFVIVQLQQLAGQEGP